MFDAVRVSSRASAQVLVVGQFKGQKLDRETAGLDPDGSVKAAAGRAEATGEPGAIAEATPSQGYRRVLVVGLGEKSELDRGRLRPVAAAVGRRLAQTKETGAAVELGGALKSARLDAGEAGCGFGEGLGLLAWTCDDFRGSVTGKTERTRLSVGSSDGAFVKGMKRGLGLAESANLTRTLSQTPPNVATPMWMASQARALARKTGMTCTVIKGRRLEEEKLVGIRTVGRASENEPCLVRLEYRPSGSRAGGKPAVLVGKTITYDTGGLSLKISGSMRGMKRDKDGGCAVLGAMHAIATVVRPKRRVVALLACAENAVSDNAYRPDDVLTFRNGVSVEVTNTDAEGRLVLADALCWACAKEKPEYIVDVATLTGGVVVALGSVYAGLWCDDDGLRGRLECAAEGSGERLWRLPHHREYREMMKSQVADIVNSAPVRAAHPIQGAAFLSYFCEDGIPWAHVDIAGVHDVEKDTGPYVAGPTGFGARLLAELLAAE